MGRNESRTCWEEEGEAMLVILHIFFYCLNSFLYNNFISKIFFKVLDLPLFRFKKRWGGGGGGNLLSLEDSQPKLPTHHLL